MPTKKYFKKMLKNYGSNCDRKSHLSGTLTEPLNPRARYGFNLQQVYLQ